jgi:hypothetical protein
MDRFDLLRLLCAGAAFFLPLGFAWFVLRRTARRHRHGAVRSAGPRRPPAR